MLSKIIRFIRDDVWRIQIRKLPRRKYFFIRALRVFLLSLSEFNNDQCQLRASSLTFYSLLSIVPVLAMFFGIAKGFQIDQRLEEWLLAHLETQEEVLRRIILFSHTMLENTKGSIIAGVGVALLFWTVIRVLGNIEKSFDHIWGVKKERSLLRKFTDYLSLMMILPVLVITASSLNVYVTRQVTLYSQHMMFQQFFDPFIFMILGFLSYSILWALLSFLYTYMPNTKVEWKSALLGGIVAGTLYQLVQWTYIKFQIQVNSLGAVYGSFAALPFFLIWLQLSWLIILYGAEIAFAFQNEEHYEFESDSQKASLALKKLVAMEIVHMCVRSFSKGDKPPWTAIRIADYLDSPIRLIRNAVNDLIEAGLLSEIKNLDEKESALQPAVATDLLTIGFVNRALERTGVESLPLADKNEIKLLKDRLQKIEEAIEKSPDNVRLINI